MQKSSEPMMKAAETKKDIAESHAHSRPRYSSALMESCRRRRVLVTLGSKGSLAALVIASLRVTRAGSSTAG